MEKYFEDLTVIRQHLIEYLEAFELNQLIFIPMGYRNHIFWNCAHVLVTQQLMTYYLANVPMLIDHDWVARFKKGTFGEQNVTEDEVKQLIEWLESTAVQLRKDYFAERLSNFNAYETSFGIPLNGIQDAIRFNNLHESLHLGYIMAMLKNMP